MEKKSKNPTTTEKTISDSLIDKIREFHSIQAEPRDIFQNYVMGHGTSLTKRGFGLIQPILSFHKVEVPKSFDFSKNRNKILLARAMKYPYYVEKNVIWVSNSEDAFLLTLYSGDIERWADSSRDD